MFNHKYRYLFIFVLSIYTYLSTVLCDVYYYFHLHIEWYVAFLTILLVGLFTWESSRLMQPYFLKKYSKSNNKFKYIGSFFALACIVTTGLTTGIVFFISMVVHNHTIKETFIPLKLNLIYAWLANLLFHLVNTVKFYFEEYKNKYTEAETLKILSAQTELQLIKNQINPHFLFNNLNVLSALVMKDTKDANKFIEEFSKVYRYILSNHDKELVPIQDEMEFIKPYIFLLEKRFSEGLHININIPKYYDSFHVIPASLQMLIENAIKHNVVSKKKPLHIDIHVNGNNTIVVENNLQLRSSVEHSTRIGLHNISKRYLLVSGKDVEIENNEMSFKVTIPLISLN